MGFKKAYAFRHVLDVTVFMSTIASVNGRFAETEKKRGQFKDVCESGDFMESIRDVFRLDLEHEYADYKLKPNYCRCPI